MRSATWTLFAGLWVVLSVTAVDARDRVYYYHNDHLGTPQALSNAAGSKVWEAEYEPFGKAAVNEDPDGDGISVINNLRFPGQYYDAETGLHYNYHRDYQPETGRYLEPDPVGLAGGLNLYAYASNNAISNFDRWGLFGEGGLGAKYKGHRDFTGGGFFDYNLEDTDKKTNPINGDPERHFRDLSISEVDAAEAIASCQKEKFQRAMHRGQDYFSHYAKGYRWMPRTWGKRCLGYGHACDGTKPDEDPVVWNSAEIWTKARIREWDQKCGCIARE